MNDSWLAYCLDLARGPNSLSNRDIHKLKSFYMAQQALSRELLAAKQLGICKTSISGRVPTEEDIQVVNGGTTGKGDSKETLS